MDPLHNKLLGVLANPELYPPELKAFISTQVASDPTFRLGASQLPVVEKTSYVGATSSSAAIFVNSWTNTGGGYESAGFYKDPFRRVHLCGRVSGGTAGSTIFTLPSGYRPKAKERFAVDINGSYGFVEVDASGNVIHGAALGTTGVQLSGITFRAL